MYLCVLCELILYCLLVVVEVDDRIKSGKIGWVYLLFLFGSEDYQARIKPDAAQQ